MSITAATVAMLGASLPEIIEASRGIIRLVMAEQERTEKPGPEKLAGVLEAVVPLVQEIAGQPASAVSQEVTRVVEEEVQAGKLEDRRRRVASALSHWLSSALALDGDDDGWVQVQGATLRKADVSTARDLLRELSQ